MSAGEIIAIILSALIIGAALIYLIKAKKSGKKCIGCPDAASCIGACGACNCGCKSKNEETK